VTFARKTSNDPRVDHGSIPRGGDVIEPLVESVGRFFAVAVVARPSTVRSGKKAVRTLYLVRAR
jgi:hypothetical protein